MEKIDKIIVKFPIKLQRQFQQLISLGESGWSSEWQKLAKEIIMQMNDERDKGNITVDEWKYIHTTYLHDVGHIGVNGYRFFNFALSGKLQ
mgnify:FL=1